LSKCPRIKVEKGGFAPNVNVSLIQEGYLEILNVDLILAALNFAALLECFALFVQNALRTTTR